MALVLERSNSCPGEIWCDEDTSNPGYHKPLKVPQWYEYWSALEFWHIRQRRISQNWSILHKDQ